PDELNWWYGIMASSGVSSYFNYALFHFKALRPLFLWFWNRTKKAHPIEGVCAEYARAVKPHLGIPVICTGGFQDARLIRRVISEGYCDAVSIARPLVANNDRSEEHTSELQSLAYLVCRLLLEKKKTSTASIR